MTTVKVFMPARSGITGQTLWLYKSSDFSLVNTGGDTLSESGTTGVFTAAVTETWTETLYATVKTGSGNPCWYGYLLVSSTEITETSLSSSGGGGGGGDATLAKQVEILNAITTLGNDQLATVEVDAGIISGFPETLTIGDSYTSDTGQIKVLIKDANGSPLTALGTMAIIDADISFKAFRPNDSSIIVGTCEYFDNTPTESYVLITLHSSETIKGKAEFTYEGRLKFAWLGASASDTDDDVQKTYKTTPFKFLANP